MKLAKVVNADFGSPDQLALNMFELNLFKFSAAKSAAAVVELNAIARDSDTFADFKQKAGVLTDKHVKYMRTEYDYAWNASHNAATYHTMRKQMDEFPTWVYQTTGDERVRPGHQVLNNMKFKADDPAFDSIYPPNGWGCRCYVKPLRGVPNQYSTYDDAKEALAKSQVNEAGDSELDVMIKGGFNKNRAKIRTIFDEDKFYIKKNLAAKLTWQDQGMEAYAELNKSGFPQIAIKERDILFAEKLLTKNGNLFSDYANRAIEFTDKTLKAHARPDRLNIIELVPDVLKTPDEVYLFEKGASKTIQLKHIKHYRDRSIVTVSDITDDGMQLKTWFEADAEKFDSDWRTGILIKKSL